MTISRHDPEWLKVIFLAGAAGVRFDRHILETFRRHHTTCWSAHLPDGNTFVRRSKFLAARAALFHLEHGHAASGADAPLPDAATTPTGRAPSRPALQFIKPPRTVSGNTN